MKRQDGRALDELRPIKITTDFVKFAEGSCLIQCGDTMVLCCASIENRTPPHVPEGEGWVTAEYSMLPRANRERSKRDIAKLKLSPRSAEIQRLVGRSLRAAVDMEALGEHTITIDCDVIQGDGGTRTASVTGGFIALALACRRWVEQGILEKNPIREGVAAVSVGVVDDVPRLDLMYVEDSAAQVDMNVVITSSGRFIELQGTGEERPFTQEELDQLLVLARKGAGELLALQEQVIGEVFHG
jgi:ribonuclease PH